MSQSVNRGEKPAASEAAADAVEPVEAAVPAESVEPAEDAAAVEEAEDDGGYRLDIAVEYRGRKIAVECDGDRFHSTDEQLAGDLKRQSQLERLGWRFIRIRGSEFFRAPEATLERVHKELADHEIFPEKSPSAVGDERRDELFERVKIRAQELLIEWGLCD